jgi:predicted metal-dependent phosphotriesterase family hydrolase
LSFIRTVLGDIPAEDLGTTYAHEHLAIGPGRIVDLEPDFRLDDRERGLEELAIGRAAGLQAVIDAMPCDAGRDVELLAALSRGSGVHVVAATGLHLARYYEERHWSVTYGPDELADLFAADIEVGIDAGDYGGPIVRRTAHRAGIIKVAGSPERLTARDRKVFEAAAAAHLRTGCPVLTHCTDGTGALDQLRVLADAGVDPRHVVLSHTDKVVDRGYHHAILATGAAVEYDQAFRWPPDAENGTLRLLEWMVSDDYADRIMLGMDAARQRYWTSYGGAPGLGFLLGPFRDRMRAAGLDEAVLHAIFVATPARVFAFAPAPSDRPSVRPNAAG